LKPLLKITKLLRNIGLHSRINRAKISISFQPTKHYNVMYYYSIFYEKTLVIIVVEMYYPIFLSNIFSNYFKQWSLGSIKTTVNYDTDYFKWCSHSVTANSNRSIKIYSLCTYNRLLPLQFLGLKSLISHWNLHLKKKHYLLFFYKRSFNTVWYIIFYIIY